MKRTLVSREHTRLWIWIISMLALFEGFYFIPLFLGMTPAISRGEWFIMEMVLFCSIIMGYIIRMDTVLHDSSGSLTKGE